ncbi:VOC family protein [Bacillus sp. T33-2]|uniref:VOC family protein n=1 Tax=Bacillus sp. T33-2 TaxID=2054168 RepID=UPI000C75F298|nr:VOC family protein [Bacillus sp. T33-2]PLR94802.1 hypothetical protein CVD19_16140 [Bacillus sp. T33-2]
MKFYEVHFDCFNLEEMKRFYTEVLEMDLVSETDSHFAIMAGMTKIFFEKSTVLPYYHVCFRTGGDHFDFMFERLSEKRLLLPNEQGDYSLYWEGKQAYFVDPDGNILEMLERPFLYGDKQTEGWHDVFEVGLPSKNVASMQGFLINYITDEYKADNDTFAFFGDHGGVFVAVKEGRNWYPTERASTIHPIRAVVSGKQEATLKHDELPYEFIVKKEWEGRVPAVQVRSARPTNQLDKIIEFYRDGIGLKMIGGFKKHEGYDGAMLGLPDHSCHLEFTQHEHPVDLPVPTKEHLLVFYIPNRFERDRVALRLAKMGYEETEPDNPYWARGGITFLDPDGWCVVLMNSAGI